MYCISRGIVGCPKRKESKVRKLVHIFTVLIAALFVIQVAADNPPANKTR